MKPKKEYKDKPPYQAVYGIEAAFEKTAALMYEDILKKISEKLNKKK